MTKATTTDGDVTCDQVLLRKELFLDLLHPNAAGYDVMGKEIQKILSQHDFGRDTNLQNVNNNILSTAHSM